MIFEYVNVDRYPEAGTQCFSRTRKRKRSDKENHMNHDELNRRAEVLKVLSHPQRLCILRGINMYHCNVGKIQETLGLTQSGLSQHISKLKAAGIIKGERNGKEICYRVVDETALRIVDMMFEGIE